MMRIDAKIALRQRAIIKSWPFSTRLRNVWARLDHGSFRLPSPQRIQSLSVREFRSLWAVGKLTAAEFQRLQERVWACVPPEQRPKPPEPETPAGPFLRAGVAINAEFWRGGVKALAAKLGWPLSVMWHRYLRLLAHERRGLSTSLPCAATCSKKVLRVLLGCGVKTPAGLAALDVRQVLGFDGIAESGYEELRRLIGRQGGRPRDPLSPRGVTQRAITTPALLESASVKTRLKMLARMKPRARWAYCRQRWAGHPAEKRSGRLTWAARIVTWRKLPKIVRTLVAEPELALLAARWRPDGTLPDVARQLMLSRERIRQRAADAAGAILADARAAALLAEMEAAALQRAWLPGPASFRQVWGPRNLALVRAVACETVPGMVQFFERPRLVAKKMAFAGCVSFATVAPRASLFQLGIVVRSLDRVAQRQPGRRPSGADTIWL